MFLFLDFFGRVGGSSGVRELFGFDPGFDPSFFLLDFGEKIVVRGGGWFLEWGGVPSVRVFDRNGRWLAKFLRCGRVRLPERIMDDDKVGDIVVRRELANGEVVEARSTELVVSQMQSDRDMFVKAVEEFGVNVAYATSLQSALHDVVRLHKRVIEDGLRDDASDKQIDRSLKTASEILDRIGGKAVQRTAIANIKGDGAVPRATDLASVDVRDGEVIDVDAEL